MATSHTLFRMKGMRLLVIVCTFSLQESLSFLLFRHFFSSNSKEKMAARFFLHGDHLVKVVLSETPFLRPVQYDRMFLDSVQYENLLHVFSNANSREQFSGYIISLVMRNSPFPQCKKRCSSGCATQYLHCLV